MVKKLRKGGPELEAQVPRDEVDAPLRKKKQKKKVPSTAPVGDQPVATVQSADGLIDSTGTDDKKPESAPNAKGPKTKKLPKGSSAPLVEEAGVSSAEGADTAPGVKKVKKRRKVDADEGLRNDVDDQEVPKKKKKKAGIESTDEPLKSSDAQPEPEGVEPKSPLNPEPTHPDLREWRVVVHNLPRHFDEATLRKDWGACGEIADFYMLMDRDYGTFRGIAFITFQEEAGLIAALKFHGDDYGGRTLKVAIAEPRADGKIHDGIGYNASKGKGKGKKAEREGEPKGKGKGKDAKGKGKGKGKDGKGKGKGWKG